MCPTCSGLASHYHQHAMSKKTHVPRRVLFLRHRHLLSRRPYFDPPAPNTHDVSGRLSAREQTCTCEDIALVVKTDVAEEIGGVYSQKDCERRADKVESG